LLYNVGSHPIPVRETFKKKMANSLIFYQTEGKVFPLVAKNQTSSGFNVSPWKKVEIGLELPLYFLKAYLGII
jgi:hypothetical protein